MSRVKIDYGIDLGTTNSAICRMDGGEPAIKKSDTLKDTMPSCVFVNKKKGVQVGDSAYNALKKDKFKAMRTWNAEDSNSYIEFKRTMGTDKVYPSTHLEKEFTSEDLSSEVLKQLKTFVKDEAVNAIVITVPAKFTINQNDATMRAGNIAGFKHIELLQEPIAASMAYGLESDQKDGFWLVFDYGGGTFDAALLKVEEGIMMVKDTDGDNYLGGKNLDMAIVDEVIIPYLKENYAIEGILAEDKKKQVLRDAMKFYAEDAKIKLSFNDLHNILSDLGDIPGEDENGEEFELDITVTRADMNRVLGPIFQKAIDITKELLERNNLKGSDLGSLILVGGPTFSPVLRDMLGNQICAPDTSTDPMTAVARGAALYASTIDVSEEILEEVRDTTKVQLQMGHEASTVETEEFVTVKVLADKMDGDVPEGIQGEITRGDKAWSSGRFDLSEKGDVIEVQLDEGRTNSFIVDVFDSSGNKIDSEPNSFNIIQGSKIGSATLPYNIGIEIKEKASGKIIFTAIRGVEKNQSLPAIGTRNALKTQNQIRPGEAEDFIKFPIYQGETGAEGTRAIYNEHVYDVVISGEDLPALLPENSDVDLTINVDKSQKISLSAYIPYLDYTHEIEVPSNQVQSIDTEWLANEIRKGKGSITEIKDDPNMDYNDHVRKIEQQLALLETQFLENKDDVDNKQQVLSTLRRHLKDLDDVASAAEWPRIEENLNEWYLRLEGANAELGNERTTRVVDVLKKQKDEVVAKKDIKLGRVLIEEMEGVYVHLTLLFQLMNFLRHHNENFHRYSWRDKSKARDLLDQGMNKMTENPSKEELHPIAIAVYDLLPPEEQPAGDKSVLVG